MNNETYEALKDLIKALEFSNKTNDFSYFILNSNPTRGNLVAVRKWIDEVAKDYTEKARDEYNQLRKDDKDFANQWDDTEEDFQEWYKDVYLLNQ